jgi:predicted transcriptional regulator
MENRAMTFRIALRILEDEERLRDLKRSEIRAKIDEGLEDIRAGRTAPVEEVFDKLRRLIAADRMQRDPAE